MVFNRHFSEADISGLLDGLVLPEGFLFGAANSAFQVEGGFNGPGEPLNNWVELEHSGKVEPSGEAIRFWTDYPEQIETARAMGLNGFRVGIEWARVQPGTSPAVRGAPEFDRATVEAYARMFAAVFEAGMEPVVTLHHFTHPYWLGIDFWLEEQKLVHYRNYVEHMAIHVNSLLVERHGARPVKYWVTINEPNLLPLLTHVLREFPHRKGGPKASLRALTNIIRGHCIGYDSLHRVYDERGWPAPMVTCNNFNWSIYNMDKLVTDLLLARRNAVSRADLPSYIERSRAEWDDEIAGIPEVSKAPRLNVFFEKLAGKAFARYCTLENLEGAIDAMYDSPRDDKLDFLAVDYYDAFLRNYIRLPSLRRWKETGFSPVAGLWEQVLNPVGLFHFLKAETINGKGLPVIILESGMCYRVRRGRVEARQDGATRDIFLQNYLYEMLRALKDGVPVAGYFHWSLADNYEWGSYEPRFGLCTVDRSRTPVRIRSVDAWGVNACDAYSELITSLRNGGHDAAARAFIRDRY